MQRRQPTDRLMNVLGAWLLGGAAASCAAGGGGQEAAPAIEGIEWQLVEVGGRPVQVGTDRPTLRLDAAAKKASGSTGVNRFTASYELAEGSLRFGPPATTRRAGPPELMAQEQAFLQALDRTRAVKSSASGLELGGGEVVLARFAPP